MTGGPRRGILVGVVVTVLVLVGFGVYVLWPAPEPDPARAVDRVRLLDPVDVAAALPEARDLPGSSVSENAFNGSLSAPAGSDSRVVLADSGLTEQCRTWRRNGDDWACPDLLVAGMVTLHAPEPRSTLFATVLAYPDEAAAKTAWNRLVAAVRPEFADHPRAEQRSPGLGDASVSFTADGLTVVAIRVESVVVEADVSTGISVSEVDVRVLVERWTSLLLAKIDKLLR